MHTAPEIDQLDFRREQQVERPHADDLLEDSINDQEMERLHADDLQAGRIVVGIMTGVFFVGLLMYSVICWIAMR